MAKGQDFTRYQKGIVNRYYEHRDTLMLNKLGEIISEIYLCEDPRKTDKLWESAATALKNTQANPVRVAKLLSEKNIKGLAQLLSELTVPDGKATPARSGPASAAASPAPAAAAAPVTPAAATPASTGTPGAAVGATPGPTPAAGEISPDTLKAALKAFKKRLKLTQLEEDSKLGYGPVGSRKSTVTAVMPPNQFPRQVWAELVKQGKLRSAGSGTYELLEP